MYHFIEENRENDSDNFKNFGLKNLVTLPQNELLIAFKNDMYDVIRKLEFTNIRIRFLDTLNKEVESTQS